MVFRTKAQREWKGKAWDSVKVKTAGEPCAHKTTKAVYLWIDGFSIIQSMLLSSESRGQARNG